MDWIKEYRYAPSDTNTIFVPISYDDCYDRDSSSCRFDKNGNRIGISVTTTTTSPPVPTAVPLLPDVPPASHITDPTLFVVPPPPTDTSVFQLPLLPQIEMPSGFPDIFNIDVSNIDQKTVIIGIAGVLTLILLLKK